MNGNRSPRSKVFAALWALAALMALAAIGHLAATCRTTEGLYFYRSADTRSWGEGWVNDWGQTVSLPYDLPPEAEGTMTVRKTVDEEVAGQWLLIRASVEFLTLSLDGQVLCEHRLPDEGYIGRNPGSAWCLARIPRDSEGGELRIRVSKPYKKDSTVISEPFVGTRFDLMAMLRETYGSNVAIAMLLFLLGGFLELSAAYLALRGVPSREVVWLGLFSMFSALWIFDESKMMQFYIGNPFWIANMAYVALGIFPIFLLLFVDGMCHPHGPRLLRWGAALLTANAAITALLVALRVADYYELLLSTHLCIGLAFVALVYVLGNEIFRHHNPDARRIAWPHVLLLTATLLEFGTYYLDMGGHLSQYFQLGLLLYFLTFVFQTFTQIQRMWMSAREAESYERMAFQDALTGLGNRAAYMRRLESEPEALRLPLRLLFFDLNDLKRINDGCGHSFGDEAIILCASCIRNAFSALGPCFRIGGDEFACIIQEDSPQRFEAAMEAFRQGVREADAGTEYPFAVASGSAVTRQPLDAQALRELTALADERLYRDKAALKQQAGSGCAAPQGREAVGQARQERR